MLNVTPRILKSSLVVIGMVLVLLRVALGLRMVLVVLGVVAVVLAMALVVLKGESGALQGGSYCPRDDSSDSWADSWRCLWWDSSGGPGTYTDLVRAF